MPADVATSMFSGIFNIGIGGGAFIGSRVSAEFGFATVPYVACALIGVWCAGLCGDLAEARLGDLADSLR